MTAKIYTDLMDTLEDQYQAIVNTHPENVEDHKRIFGGSSPVKEPYTLKANSFNWFRDAFGRQILNGVKVKTIAESRNLMKEQEEYLHQIYMRGHLGRLFLVLLYKKALEYPQAPIALSRFAASEISDVIYNHYLHQLLFRVVEESYDHYFGSNEVEAVASLVRRLQTEVGLNISVDNKIQDPILGNNTLSLPSDYFFRDLSAYYTGLVFILSDKQWSKRLKLSERQSLFLAEEMVKFEREYFPKGRCPNGPTSIGEPFRANLLKVEGLDPTFDLTDSVVFISYLHQKFRNEALKQGVPLQWYLSATCPDGMEEVFDFAEKIIVAER